MSSRWKSRVINVIGAVVLIALSIDLIHYIHHIPDLRLFDSLDKEHGSKEQSHDYFNEHFDEFGQPEGFAGLGNHVKPPMEASTINKDPSLTATALLEPSGTESPSPEKSFKHADTGHSDRMQHYLKDSRDRILQSQVDSLSDPPRWSNSDILHPLGKEVVILTLNGSSEMFRNSEALQKSSVSNKESYCNRHKYELGVIDYEDYIKDMTLHMPDIGWLKLSILRSALTYYPNAQWFWWIEEDALIMNRGIDLAKYILDSDTLSRYITYDIPISDWAGKMSPERVYLGQDEVEINDISFIIPHGRNGIKLNSFFVRRSAFSRELLDQWDAPRLKKNFAGQEAEALLDLICDDDELLKHVALVPERLFSSNMNVNEDNKDFGNYHYGDFVADLSSVEDNFNALWNEVLDLVVD